MYRLCEYIFECEFLRGIRDTDIVFLWKITFLNYCSSYFIVEAKTNFCRAHCFENILCWYAGTQGEAITHKFIYIAWFFENHYITASPIAFFFFLNICSELKRQENMNLVCNTKNIQKWCIEMFTFWIPNTVVLRKRRYPKHEGIVW